MELLILGVVAAVNMLIIKFKIEKARYEDAALDVFIMVVLTYLFSGTYSGMIVAMVASLFVSIVLFVSPPKFTKILKEKSKEALKELDLDLGRSNVKSESRKDKFDL